jgi:hypothetical protein
MFYTGKEAPTEYKLKTQILQSSQLWSIRNIATHVSLMHYTPELPKTTTFLCFLTQNKNTTENNIYTWEDLKPTLEESELLPLRRGHGPSPLPFFLFALYPVITPPLPSFSLKISEQCKYRARSEAWRLGGIHFTRFVNALSTQQSNGVLHQNSISRKINKDCCAEEEFPLWMADFSQCQVLHLTLWVWAEFKEFRLLSPWNTRKNKKKVLSSQDHAPKKKKIL